MPLFARFETAATMGGLLPFGRQPLEDSAMADDRGRLTVNAQAETAGIRGV